MKRLGKMIGSQETYTKMSKILKDTLNNMNNHYENTDRLLEDAGYHQDQDFLKAEYEKHEQVMKHYDNIIKELKEFINTVDTDIDEFDKTMKDNRDACDEEKIDITEIMDENTKIYLNDELIKFLQDYTIKNNRIKMYEAGTIDELKKIKDLYGEPVWIKIKYYDKEIVLTGTLTKYKLSYDGLMYIIEYTIELY